MSEVSKDDLILSVLAKRLVDERLPKAIALKQRVDQGGVLDNLDIAFLEHVMADVRNIPVSVRDDKQFKEVAGRMMQLYADITKKALENEQAQKPE